MSNAQPEPSMEEILANIRRIISEDEEETPRPAARAPVRPAAVEPAPRAAAPIRPVPQPVAAEPTPIVDDEPAEPRYVTEDVEMIKRQAAAAVRIEDEAMVTETTAVAASKAFQALSQTVRVTDGPGRTLEDMVTEMIRPMVKDWLDANLARIVEEKVEAEVERVARRGR